MVTSSFGYAMYALADCNNFYASCERVFEPHLECKPVIVLSNNDGCIIARSQEAKDIGFKMGEPIFKCQSKVYAHHVIVRSSNFSLYGDMSRRVMQTLRFFTPEVEVYSIDEAFLDLSGLTVPDMLAEMVRMRETVFRWTGIPISIGIGKTKTLAKLANLYAKKHPETEGVAEIPNPPDAILRKVQVGDVWGIGRQWSKKLQMIGIKTALDLAITDEMLLRKSFNIAVMKTAMELRGHRFFSLEQTPEQRKTILRSCSFGSAVTSWQDMSDAIASHATRAAEKLRQEELVAKHLRVFMHTSLFNQFEPRYSGSDGVDLLPPTNTTNRIIKGALAIARSLWKDGFKYKRAGVYMSDLAKDRVQQSLFETEAQIENDNRVMQVLDDINAKMGASTIHFAASGFSGKWHMRQLNKSPRYTTRWDELPVITL